MKSGEKMKYDNNSIVALKGPERVRKRPAVMFGSDDMEGVISVIKTLLNIFVTEAARGCSTGIDVNVHHDNSISICSHDRGFLLDETIIDGKPAWYQNFCELYCGPRELDENYELFLGCRHSDLYGTDASMPKYYEDADHGFDLCCVQYVSKFMHVEAIRDGTKKILDFEKGYSISDLRKEPSEEPTGTFIHFLVDSEVFGDINFPISEIVEFLRDVAITIPGLKCEISDVRNNISTTFLYPKGTVDYAAEISSTISIPLFSNEMEAKGKDRYNYREYEAKVKIVLGFVKDSSNTICLHNYRKLEYGGYHLDAVKEQMLHYINWEFIWDFRDDSSSNDEDNYYSRRRFELSFDDIKDNIVLIIETNCTQYASNYVNATKKAIKNRMITDMAHDLISGDFQYYLKQNHEAIFDILKDVKRVKEDGQC